MTKTGEAKHWIDKNLWAIMAVGLALYGGYLTGQVTTGMRLDQLEVGSIERKAQLAARKDFMFCAVRMIDWLENNQPGEKPCKLEVMQ